MTTKCRAWSRQRGRVLAMCGCALLLSVPAPAQDEAAKDAALAGLAKPRTTPPTKQADGSLIELRFTRYNVTPDRFESKMEYSLDGGKASVQGNHQLFERRGKKGLSAVAGKTGPRSLDAEAVADERRRAAAHGRRRLCAAAAVAARPVGGRVRGRLHSVWRVPVDEDGRQTTQGPTIAGW